MAVGVRKEKQNTRTVTVSKQRKAALMLSNCHILQLLIPVKQFKIKISQKLEPRLFDL